MSAPKASSGGMYSDVFLGSAASSGQRRQRLRLRQLAEAELRREGGAYQAVQLIPAEDLIGAYFAAEVEDVRGAEAVILPEAALAGPAWC